MQAAIARLTLPFYERTDNAAKMAVGLGAHVSIIDLNLNRLRELDDIYDSQIVTLASNSWTISETLRLADLVVGAVLIPGASAPKLVRKEMLKFMKKGAVMVDVAIDQGGCFETSRPTTHSAPTYVEEGVVHYCVTNMPGAVARTSTFALTNATLPFVIALATKGWRGALRDDPHLCDGLNVHAGQVTYAAVARDLGFAYVPADTLLGGS